MTSPPSSLPDLSSQTLILPDGRTLGYALYGAPLSPETPTLLYFHGFPTSRLEASHCTSAPLTTTATIISIDRPGYGLSSFQASRRILDWPSDVLVLCDALEIQKFYILADSGGAPYALVCAKEIPKDRVIKTGIASGIYPISLGTEGMLFGVKLILYGGYYLPQWLVIKLLDMEFGTAARDADRSLFEKAFMKGMESKPEKDTKCLEDAQFRGLIVESMREAFIQGTQGPAWDCGLYGDWGFELEEVDADVVIWHGKLDVNALSGMAEKAAKLLKGSTLRVWEEETHLSLPCNHVREMICELLGL